MVPESSSRETEMSATHSSLEFLILKKKDSYANNMHNPLKKMILIPTYTNVKFEQKHITCGTRLVPAMSSREAEMSATAKDSSLEFLILKQTVQLCYQYTQPIRFRIPKQDP